eukprot:TRINITY_DN8879_c0_g1_i5.p1 TRINITY_DN8879_c0_g1~~TRINITY_DN8879_c0_g1_i5.p1  ORF type:complete len:256 (+),score=54.29 TRINITY_DN8879_c0_g1_i5:2-769(+)
METCSQIPERAVGIGANVRVYCSLDDPATCLALPSLAKWLTRRRSKKSRAAADAWFNGKVVGVSQGSRVTVHYLNPALGRQHEFSLEEVSVLFESAVVWVKTCESDAFSWPSVVLSNVGRKDPEDQDLAVVFLGEETQSVNVPHPASLISDWGSETNIRIQKVKEYGQGSVPGPWQRGFADAAIQAAEKSLKAGCLSAFSSAKGNFAVGEWSRAARTETQHAAALVQQHVSTQPAAERDAHLPVSPRSEVHPKER